MNTTAILAAPMIPVHCISGHYQIISDFKPRTIEQFIKINLGTDLLDENDTEITVIEFLRGWGRWDCAVQIRFSDDSLHNGFAVTVLADTSNIDIGL